MQGRRRFDEFDKPPFDKLRVCDTAGRLKAPSVSWACRRAELPLGNGPPASGDPTFNRMIPAKCYLSLRIIPVSGLPRDTAQALLGPACLQATQIYAHVSIKALQEVHVRTDPAAKLAQPRRDALPSTP